MQVLLAQTPIGKNYRKRKWSDTLSQESLPIEDDQKEIGDYPVLSSLAVPYVDRQIKKGQDTLPFGARP